LHKTKGTVYAYRCDLEAWLSQRSVKLSQTTVSSRPRLGDSDSPSGSRKPPLLPTQSLEAYRFYLQGRRNWELRTREGFERGIDCFQNAIQEDAAFALAFVGIADCWNMLGFHSLLPPRVAFSKARAAATEALSLGEDSAEVRTSLGFTVLFHDWDWTASAASFERALKIRADYAPGHYWYGLNLAALGRPYDAIQHVRRAQELDPLSPVINTYVAGAFYFARQFEAAEAKCRLALETDPDFALARLVLGWNLREQSRFDLAVEELKNASGRSRDYVDGLAALGHCFGVAGHPEEAAKVLDELHRTSRTNFVSSGHRAMVLLGLGHHEEALRQLAEAHRERYPWLVFLKLDPIFDPLRRKQAFQDLVKRVGL
jgi:tetratricopeptide (TPR) repeat protein